MDTPLKFNNVKVLALDIFGTILATDDYDEEAPPRRGIDELLNTCMKKDIKICTCSDVDTTDVIRQLRNAEIPLSYFNKFFKMPPKGEKNIAEILDYYDISPIELLVIGDTLKREIKPARDLGCQFLPVPEYLIFIGDKKDEFDFSKVEINYEK